jgi:hypothetical protein
MIRRIAAASEHFSMAGRHRDPPYADALQSPAARRGRVIGYPARR